MAGDEQFYDSLFAEEERRAREDVQAPDDVVYEAIIAEEAAGPRILRNAALNEAVKANPDQVARNAALAARTGLPIEVVGLNGDIVRQMERVRELHYLAQSSPILARQLADPEFAKIAHDDAEQLGLIEGTINAFKRGWRSLEQFFPATALRANADIIRRLREAEAGQLPAREIDDPLALNYLDATQRAELLGQAQVLAGRQAGEIAHLELEKRAIPQDPIVAQALNAKSFSEFWHYFSQKPAAFISQVGAESITASAPGLVAAVPAGAVGGPGGAAAALGAGSFFTDYASSVLQAMQDEGVDLTDPKAIEVAIQDKELMKRVGERAATHATVVAALDAASGGLASKTMVPSALARRPLAREAANIAAQAPVQGTLGAVGEASGQIASGQEFQPGQVMAEFLGELTGTPVEVASASGKRMLELARLADAAAEDAHVLSQLQKLAVASKLRERSPATFAEFLQEAAKEGPVEEVYVDPNILAQTLEQAGVEAPKSVTEQLPEALATGVDVKIPVGDYAAYIAPAAPDLVAYLKTHPGAMSAAEAETFYQEQVQMFRDTADKILAENAQNAELQASADQVKEHFLEQLGAVNRFTPQVNEAYATLMRDFYVTTAQRLGITPIEMLQRYPLRVAAENVANELVLDQGPSNTTRIRGSNGMPLVMFRGAAAPLAAEHFQPQALGQATGHTSSGLGVFFTPSRAEAAKYGKVEKFYLDVRNPLVMRAEDVPAFETAAEATAFREQLRAQGYDGIIITARHLGGSTNVVAFSPEQVVPVERSGTFLQQAIGDAISQAIALVGERQFQSLGERALLEERARLAAQGVRDITPEQRNAAIERLAQRLVEHGGELPGTFEQSARPESDVGHKREISTGRYVGAPDWVGKSPQALAALRQKLRQLAHEGEQGRYWYERSSKAILDLVGGDKAEAEKIVALIAIYSPNATVPANASMALTAYYQWKAGMPIDAGFGSADEKAENFLRKGEMWSGIKINSFYQNLMQEIDPSKNEAQNATMDMWMALAFDYGMKTVDQGPKYMFMQREIQRLGAELGWAPHQVQAAIWTAMKARIDPIRDKIKQRELKLGIGEVIRKDDGGEIYRIKPERRADHYHLAHKMGMAYELKVEDVLSAKYDFADAIEARLAQISWEATPGRTSGVLPQLLNATLAEKQEYLLDVMKAIAPDGRDLIAEAVGLPQGTTLLGFSAWEGDIGAGAQTFVAVPSEGVGKKRAVKTPARKLLNAYAALKGYVLSQDAVVWHHPVYDDSKIRHNGAEIVAQRALTADEMRQLYDALHVKFGTWELAPGYAQQGARILNFVEGLDNKRFQAGVEEVLNALPKDFGGGAVELVTYRSDGEYIGNNWQENPDGQSYKTVFAEGRQDILERADGIRARVQAVNERWAARFAQIERGGTYKQSARDAARDARDSGAIARRVAGEEVLGRVIEGHSRQVGAETPVVQFRRGKNPAAIVGIHYGNAPGLGTLDATKFGTGTPSQEANRLGFSVPLKKRVYFYAQMQDGALPESERIVSGPYAYRALVDNLYDFEKDPDGILPRWRELRKRPEVLGINHMTLLEDMVLNEGYDGYIVREHAGVGTAAVVMGHDSVPVEYLGDRIEAAELLAGEHTFEQAPRPGEILAYHGTTRNVKNFRPGKNKWGGEDLGVHFGSAEAANRRLEDARKEGRKGAPNIQPVYLTLVNPLRLEDVGNWSSPSRVKDAVAKVDQALADRIGEVLRPYAKTDNEEGAMERVRQVLISAGYDGVVYENEYEGGGDSYIVFRSEQVRSVFSVEQPARGQISFGPDITKQDTVLTLLKNADLSTFLHETGHFFLEVLVDVASRPDAPADITADVNTVLDWFGIQPKMVIGPDGGERQLTKLETWRQMTTTEKREYHEKFARGFEAYLFEGKAPSLELKGLFARFRAWLINVYRSITALDVELTSEVRAVFDRLLASGEEIRTAEGLRAMAPMFSSPEEAAATETEWQKYQALGAQATDDAARALERKALDDLKWLRLARSRVLKQLQAETEAKREAIRREVEAEIHKEPVYAAIRWLKTGVLPDGEKTVGAKIRLDSLKEIYGDGPAAAWRYLPTGPHGLVAVEGLPADTVGEMFGFSSGDELVRAILNAEPMESVIESKTDQRMLEEHGDLVDPVQIQKAADEAVHNEARARFVAQELQFLDRAANVRQRTPSGGYVNVLNRAAKAFAEQILAHKRIRDIKPGQFAAAEARAAKAAMAASSPQEKAVEKRNQLVNLHATKLAYNAVDEVNRGIRYLKKFESEGTRQSLDVEYLDQIDQLLERFDLRKRSQRELRRRASLVEWVEAQRENGFEPTIDKALLSEASRQEYTTLTLEEFRGLIDAVKNIEHLGRLKKKLLTAKDEREFAAVVDELSGSIRANARGTTKERRASDRGPLVDVVQLFRDFLADHRKFASLAHEMDGFKDAGPMWERLVRTMNERGTQEASMREKATIRLGELFASILKGERLGKKMFIPAVGKSFTREERLGIALNMGNETNRERVLTGEKWTPTQLQAVLDTLTKEEWDFVQSVWDYLESFRPAIAEKERRVTGVEPEWVEATPVVTKYGIYKGGYYPIKYDPLRSSRAEADTAAEVQRQIERGLYARAQTRRGHLEQRVQSTGRPLRYDLGVISSHVTQVIHDLAWHEWLIDANRLMRAGAIDAAIREHYGPEKLRVMKDTLRDIAIGDIAAVSSGDRVLNLLRHGATIVGMGWRLTTALVQPLGLTQSAARIGAKWVLKGAAHWFGDAVRFEGALQKIYDKSEFMRLRGKTMQREINEIRNRVRGRDSRIQASYFYLIQKLQLVADVPTWWGAYEKAMAEPGMTEDRAVALADQAVIDAQGSGQIQDLAQIQRGPASWKLFTTFYSFFNTTWNNTVEAFKRTDFRKPKDIGLLAVDLMLLYTIPAMLSTLLKAALKGDWDDEDKLARRLVADQLNYLFGTVVGLRELNAAVQASLGLEGADYQGPASVRLFVSAAKFTQQAQQGEADEAFWKSLNEFFGLLFRYPAGQINATADGIHALATGETKNPGVLLTGAPSR